jgi:hypothetical protein
MARKKHFLIVDTETTQTGKVADLGLVVCDKQGNIQYEVGVLVSEIFCDAENHPLFHLFGDAKDVFSKASLPARRRKYEEMLKDGRRLLASRAAINRLLVKIRLQYNPVLTAYNIAFDAEKMENTGLDLSIFEQRFCLWHAAAQKWGRNKDFLRFVLENGYFGNRTKKGHVGVQTKADVMAKFLLGANLPDEPHTALEDARDYERPILTALVKNTPVSEYMNPRGYNYKDFAAKDLFRPI